MIRRNIVWTALVVLAFAIPAAAQDHLDVVQRVRRELVAKGVIPAGIVNPGNNENPCGVFEITMRVAWELRAEGAGLLEKRSGNNCRGYSMDWVIYQDGRGADIAVGGVFDGVPTDSAPAWSIEVIADHGPRWRAPLEPADLPGTAPAPAPAPSPAPAPPPAPPLDLSALATKEDIARLEKQMTEHHAYVVGRVGAWEAFVKSKWTYIVSGIGVMLAERMNAFGTNPQP